MKLLITGQSGRMGQTLIEAAGLNPETELGSTHDAGEDLAKAFSKSDVAIDFTVHSFTKEVLEEALASNTPLVIGTTGHTDEEKTLFIKLLKLFQSFLPLTLVWG